MTKASKSKAKPGGTNKRMGDKVYPEMEAIEEYLVRTSTSSSALAMQAGRSRAIITIMRAGGSVSAKRVREIMQCMRANPDGIRIDHRKRGPHPKPKFSLDDEQYGHGPRSFTNVPTPSLSELPDLQQQLRAEAFKRKLSIASFLAELVTLGWKYYQEELARASQAAEDPDKAAGLPNTKK